LLQHTELSQTDVRVACGFVSPSHSVFIWDQGYAAAMDVGSAGVLWRAGDHQSGQRKLFRVAAVSPGECVFLRALPNADPTVRGNRQRLHVQLLRGHLLHGDPERSNTILLGTTQCLVMATAGRAWQHRAVRALPDGQVLCLRLVHGLDAPWLSADNFGSLIGHAVVRQPSRKVFHVGDGPDRNQRPVDICR
jgi:hypothetical protein